MEAILVRCFTLAGGGQLPFARKLAQEPPATLPNQSPAPTPAGRPGQTWGLTKEGGIGLRLTPQILRNGDCRSLGTVEIRPNGHCIYLFRELADI